MERIKAFYPTGTENILHHSKEGKVYRLDAIDQPIRVRESLSKDPRFEVVDVNERDDSVLNFTHSHELIQSYKSGKPIELAQSSGLEWQDKFYAWVINKAWSSIKAANSTLITGSTVVITSGGHHAEFENGRGFGPISNMIITAKKLLKQGDVSKIAILDLDVHYANGTHSLIKDDPRILSCDIWRYRLTKWKYTHNSKNIYHKKAENVKSYFVELDNMFLKIKTFSPDLLFVYNGLDVLDNDRMGGVKNFDVNSLFDRNARVSKFIIKNNYPVVVFIGGGYIDYTKSKDEIESSKQILTKLFVESSATILGV